MRMRLLLASVCSMGCASLLYAQSPSVPDALAATVRQLAACQIQNGQLLNSQADILAGVLVDWPTVKAQIDAANPTLELNLKTKQLTPKKESK